MRREVMRRSRGSPGRQAPGHCSALLRVGRRRRPPDTGGKLLPGRRVAIVRSPTAGGPSPLLGGAGRRPLRAKSREPSPGDDIWLGQAQLKHFTSSAIVIMGRHVPSSPDLSTMVRFDAVWVYLFFAFDLALGTAGAGCIWVIAQVGPGVFSFMHMVFWQIHERHGRR